MTNKNTTESAKILPTLRTQRLILRPWTLQDAPTIQRLADAKEIADNTASIPHPYEDGLAEQWIATHHEKLAHGSEIHLAITLADSKTIVGAIGLISMNTEHNRAELGYWVGVDWWNQGYCTEAAAEMVRYAFQHLGVSHVIGHHLTRNPASGCVMRKIGMQHESTLAKHFRKLNIAEDVEYYSIRAAD